MWTAVGFGRRPPKGLAGATRHSGGGVGVKPKIGGLLLKRVRRELPVAEELNRWSACPAACVDGSRSVGKEDGQGKRRSSTQRQPAAHQRQHPSCPLVQLSPAPLRARATSPAPSGSHLLAPGDTPATDPSRARLSRRLPPPLSSGSPTPVQPAVTSNRRPCTMSNSFQALNSTAGRTNKLAFLTQVAPPNWVGGLGRGCVDHVPSFGCRRGPSASRTSGRRHLRSNPSCLACCAPQSIRLHHPV